MERRRLRTAGDRARVSAPKGGRLSEPLDDELVEDVPPPTLGFWDVLTAPAPTRRRGDLSRAIARGARLAWHADRRTVVRFALFQLVDALASAASVLVAKVLLERVLRAGEPADAARAALGWGLLAIALTALIGATWAWREQLRHLFGERVNRHATGRVLDAVAELDLADFESPALHDALQRATTTLEYRPAVVVDSFMSLVGAAAGAAAVTIALFALHPLLPIVLVVAQVPMWVTFRMNASDEMAFARMASPLERRRGYLRHMMTMRETAAEVRAFDLTGPLRERWEQLSDERLDELLRMARRRRRRLVLGQLGSALGLAATLFGLLGLFGSDRLTAAGAGAAVLAITQLQGRLATIGWSGGALYECGVFLADSEAFLALARTARARRPDGPAPAVMGTVRAERVTFRYPDVERDALADVDIELRPGEVVALVGENGSGKTTLAKLLAHLYAPTAGRITWDGADIAAADPAALRRRISVLFQDFVQYQLTLADNIGFGDAARAADADAVRAAAEAAGVASIARQLPDGYGTMLGRTFESGRDLSKGQWQRVALARAFFRPSDLVILDEPTAALDPRAERDLFDRIRTLFAGRTVLLISHRFSSVRSADRVYVLHRGRVVEHGTHDELMAARGRYAELFTLQAEMYLGDEATR